MSSSRNTVVRSMHDLGAAAWFGGSLAGAIGINGAASDIEDPAERAKIASNGWARWSPVSAAAIGAHALGGLGLILANRGRVKDQAGVTSNTVVKTTITGLAMATTAYSGILGSKIAAADDATSAGATNPSAETPSDVAAAQRQLNILQWVTPALTALIVILGSQQGEQQRPNEHVAGKIKKALQRTS